jgi:iron donor protein CyaY
MTFSQRYDETTRRLESQLTDMIDGGAEFDLERAGDVLTVEFENGDKIIVTPNSPVEQLWISAEYQGHRFNWSDQKADWVGEKDGVALNSYLSSVLSRKAGKELSIT